jgi:lipoprotein-anchoring transpeptidase ErfK/SrfK
VNKRGFLSLLGIAAAAVAVSATPARAFLFDWETYRRTGKRRSLADQPERKVKLRKPGKKQAAGKLSYKGREVVKYRSSEKPGTIIVKTEERALYQVLPGGKAMRYLVAVGKEGFSWSGAARVGMKRVNPKWTPPPEMIERTPKYEKWRNGMPGGLPENPLGVRALYLFTKAGDTGFRIHGTNAPSSIGTAASSGCIRMLNQEVTELFDNTPVGTRVIVQ